MIKNGNKLFTSPTLIAHRGASAYAPENTLSAFELAVRMGATWVEFDVKLTRCGTPVVFHDESLERLTHLSGFINQYDYHDIAHLPIKFNHTISDACIPTFSEILNRLAEKKIYMNIEIKPNTGEEIQTTHRVIEQILTKWPDEPKVTPPVLISSFDTTALISAYESAPHLHYGCLMHEWDESIIALAHDIHARCIHCFAPLLTPTRVDHLHEQGFEVLAYTINDVHAAHTLFNMGVDAIFTDKPDLLSR